MEILNDPNREDRLHNYSCSLHRRLWNVASRQQRCAWLSLDRPGRRRSGMADGTIPGACAILYWYRCWHLRRHATPTFPTCTAIYGCILFFGMGEEISWGQRIFNIETHGFLAEANALVFFLLLNPLNKQTFRRRPAQKIVVKAVIQHAHRNAA